MNQQLTNSQRTESFVEAVLADRSGALERTLPSHIRPERFRRNLSTAIIQHPKLLGCEPGAVFNEVAKAAALGLLLDPQLGEAYLITGWSKEGDVPQLRIGYRGLMKLARQSGDVASVYAHEVCDLDNYHVELGTEKKLIHQPNFKADRGKPFAYYAVVKYKDGTTDFEPMTTREIHVIRDRSDGYRAFKAGKIKSTPWSTDEGEMAKKTVLRRLLKRVPQSPELADALAAEDRDFVDVETPSRPSPPKVQVVRATAALEDVREAAEAQAEAAECDDASQWLSALDVAIESATDGAELVAWFNEMGRTDEQWKAVKTSDPSRAAEIKQRVADRAAELRE